MQRMLGLVLMSLLLGGCKLDHDAYASSPQYRDGTFHNVTPRPGDRNTMDLLWFLFVEPRGAWPEWIENTTQPQLKSDTGTQVVSFINHATYLVEIDDKRYVFDPIFSHTAGPTSWLGSKRKRDPAMSLASMPPIDYVFISHNHYDHLDLPTLAFLVERDNPLIFVPLGDKSWLEAEGFPRIVELDWWQSYSLDNCFTVHFVPAQHSSARTPFDRDHSLWGGYVIEHPDLTVFHAGDTGYAGHFAEIGKRFRIDVALLPIGDYEPDWFLSYVHMNPQQALQAHVDLGSKQSFAMHSETFPLSTLGYLDAEKAFQRAWQQGSWQYPFTILPVGSSRVFPASGACHHSVTHEVRSHHAS